MKNNDNALSLFLFSNAQCLLSISIAAVEIQFECAVLIKVLGTSVMMKGIILKPACCMYFAKTLKELEYFGCGSIQTFVRS